MTIALLIFLLVAAAGCFGLIVYLIAMFIDAAHRGCSEHDHHQEDRHEV